MVILGSNGLSTYSIADFTSSLIFMLECLWKVGELVGGSQREERLDVLKQRYVIFNFNAKTFVYFLVLSISIVLKPLEIYCIATLCFEVMEL